MASTKLFFALSKEEKESRLKAALDAEMERVKSMNLPITYRNELCVKPNLFIHEYPNGRIELIEINIDNSKVKVIKVIKQHD